MPLWHERPKTTELCFTGSGLSVTVITTVYPSRKKTGTSMKADKFTLAHFDGEKTSLAGSQLH